MSLAARIVAQGGDLAAAGCRVAAAQLWADHANPGLTVEERRHRLP